MNKHRIGALIAAMALTLTFAGTAFATSHPWTGNGYPNETCTGDQTTALWVWTGDSPTSLTINGNVQSGTWTHNGNGSWHFTVTLGAGNWPPSSASVEYTGGSGVLTLSHCDGGTVTTTTTSDETTTSSHETTTTTSETTTSDESTTSDETTTSDESTTSDETTETTTTQTGSINTQCINCTDTTTTTTSSVSINTLCENCTDTTTTSDETTPGGHVEELTPPSTDTLAAPTSPSSVSTSLLLVLAGVLATALVVIPAAARKRR
jgi:hypothetical protein